MLFSGEECPHHLRKTFKQKSREAGRNKASAQQGGQGGVAVPRELVPSASGAGCTRESTPNPPP